MTVPVSEVFSEPCCYQLELVAHKRTIIGSRGGLEYVCYGVYRNESEYTIGVGACPPDDEPSPGVVEVSNSLRR